MFRLLRSLRTAPALRGVPRGSSAFSRQASRPALAALFPAAQPAAAWREAERTAIPEAARQDRRSSSSATHPTTGPCTRSGTERFSSAVTRCAPSVDRRSPAFSRSVVPQPQSQIRQLGADFVERGYAEVLAFQQFVGVSQDQLSQRGNPQPRHALPCPDREIQVGDRAIEQSLLLRAEGFLVAVVAGLFLHHELAEVKPL